MVIVGWAVTVLVYGLGRSGTAVATLLRRQGHAVEYVDAKIPQSEALDALGCRALTDALETSASLCIAAPGVPQQHADLVQLRESMEVIGEVEWVYRSFPSSPILGVTGTAGKTTTSQWLHDVLAQAGKKVALGGNIDPALAAVAAEDTVLVTELSSFQLERCPTLRPQTAIILNLGIDHVDRHGSVENYHLAKKQSIKNLAENNLFIYHHDDAILPSWAQAITAQGTAKAQAFSLEQPTDAYLDSTGNLILHGENLLHQDDLQVRGRHLIGNALAVSLAAYEQGLSHQQIAEGLAHFRGVAGRYHQVDTINGVHFIEDSIATRTLAVQAALEATPAPIIWLVGGQDKGADVQALEALVREKVSLAIGFGASGAAFLEKISPWTQTWHCQEMTGEASMLACCQRGYAHLTENRENYTTEHGGTVLLAPLAASFDQFDNYKERARAFEMAVAEVARANAVLHEAPHEVAHG